MPDYYSQGSLQLKQLVGPVMEGNARIEYLYEDFDIIPEVENTTVTQLTAADEKQVTLQLHLSPEPVMVNIDRFFLQQILCKMLAHLLDTVKNGSIISIYVTNSDGKCFIEAISRPAVPEEEMPEDYFKKYRITNSLQRKDNLSVYKQITQDMCGELMYNFTKKSQGKYFSLKFALA